MMFTRRTVDSATLVSPSENGALHRLTELGRTCLLSFALSALLASGTVVAAPECDPGEVCTAYEMRRMLLDDEDNADLSTSLIETLSKEDMEKACLPTAQEWKRLRKEERISKLMNLNNDNIDILRASFNSLRKTYNAYCMDRIPRIHNIGLGNTLVFERPGATSAVGPKEKQAALRIPVDGRDLDPRCVKFSVQVGGDVQLSRIPDDEMLYINYPTTERPDQANIVLLQPLLRKMKTGDRLTIQVAVSQKGIFGGDSRSRIVTYATNTFTLYELDDYRRKRANRIDPQDIAAFPLPEEEAEYLFGPIVSRLYYVVRLSVRNTEGQAKLINTGLIRAEGRAIVEPKANPSDKIQPAYTIPVTVMPQSLQHIYAIVEGTEPDLPRARTFRGLEFFGALATAINALSSNAVRAAQNIGIFTGIAIPEGKKLFPDKTPNFKKNLVDYAMPELFKVPANGHSGDKYIFFAKKDIDATIADHNQFFRADVKGGGIAPTGKVVAQLSKGRSEAGDDSPAPRVFVISLAFGNLDVRFENTVDANLESTKDTLTDLIVGMPLHIEKLKAAFASKFSPPGKAGIDKIKAGAGKIKADAKSKAAGMGADASGKLAEMAEMAEQTIKLTAALIDDPKGWPADLRDHGEWGLTAIERLKQDMDLLARRLSKGSDPELYAEKIKISKQAFEHSKLALGYYEQVAEALRADIWKALSGLEKELQGTPNKDQVEKAGKDLADALYALTAAREGEPQVSLMKGVDWEKIKSRFAPPEKGK